MNQEQLQLMQTAKGFIAALDQSGGSTPKALSQYGISPDSYDSEEKMFSLVHQMRTRIIKSPSFTNDKILGVILFERTMNSFIEKQYTADFLWKDKGIVPFLKIDKGLAEQQDGVQLMKPVSDIEELLTLAIKRNIFGTKMRSVIKEYNESGINKIVKQQFDIGKQITDRGLVPILEPEVDIHCPEKEKCEQLLLDLIMNELTRLKDDTKLLFKLTIPSKPDFYMPLINHPKVVRVVALSGGYSRVDANEKLSQNKKLIASFSRALVEGLTLQQSDKEFDSMLYSSIKSIYNASIT
ncbi:MAG: fructose bisphosphate aldolase [Spirochaetes bacterium]|nr:fructose bisphosphate aldolase [Spirochaetota bacterium]